MKKSPEGKIKTTVHLNPETFAALQLLKATKGRTAGEMIDTAVLEYMQNHLDEIQNSTLQVTKAFAKS